MQLVIYDEIIKIQPKGVITIPKKLRREVGLDDNSFARIKKEKGRITIEPIRILDYPVRSYTDDEVNEFVDYDKQLSKELRAKKLL
jgi:bifunctional DNA-binding transcriptional regulator/antitoxin component of YhaV-PrlF toxin-antitoxin module